jgi:Protein of unknown function (DUF1295)
MIAADAQKFFTLRVKRGLITDGMYRYVRHPNYLGEMMIYGSFALMVWHWLPVMVLAWVWVGMFAVNMTLKEASMSRYPEWTQYKKRSWWLLPLSCRRSQGLYNLKPFRQRSDGRVFDPPHPRAWQRGEVRRSCLSRDTVPRRLSRPSDRPGQRDDLPQSERGRADRTL